MVVLFPGSVCNSNCLWGVHITNTSSESKAKSLESIHSPSFGGINKLSFWKKRKKWFWHHELKTPLAIFPDFCARREWEWTHNIQFYKCTINHWFYSPNILISRNRVSKGKGSDFFHLFIFLTKFVSKIVFRSKLI